MSLYKTKVHCDEHVKKIHYYCPFEGINNNSDIKPKTSLKIGLISSKRVYQGLLYEADVFLLTESNWKEVLKYIKLDFLLVESCAKSAVNDWVFSQTPGSDKNILIKELIDYAKRQSITLVYWFTLDHIYHKNYLEIMKMFDHIFCADRNEIDLLKKEGVFADELRPAFQPKLYNPFRDYDISSDLTVEVLFDGWSDLFRYKNELSFLQGLKQYGLKIIDSNKEIFSNKLHEIPEFEDSILGCVTPDTRRVLLKLTKTMVSCKDSLLTKTNQEWEALEVVASKANMVFFGSLDDDDVRKNIVIEVNDDNDIESIINELNTNDLNSERKAQKNWREVNLNHTFNHRLVSICNKLEIQFENSSCEKASIVTPTYRANNIMSSIETYRRQSYNNKELLIIYNGNDEIPPDALLACKNSDDIKLLSLPEENTVGACLNLGHSMATGNYCFRVDDDDIYAPNYILDMMLSLNCADVNVFGKPPGYIQFEGNNHIFKRKNLIRPCTLVKSKDLVSGRVYLGGNTIGGRRSFLLQCPYPDKAFGAADSSFLAEAAEVVDEVLIMDAFNMLINRRADLSSHTWRLNFDEIKKSLIELEHNDINDIFV